MAVTAASLDEIVLKTVDLPSLPETALAVMREASSATSTAGSVAGIIALDHALAARILRLANSSYYGLARQVEDLQEAVTILGTRSIRNLAIVASTYPWIPVASGGGAVRAKAMWRHSFAVALGARLLARRSGMANEGAAFTAGLLHDLGKLAMNIWHERRIPATFQYAARENLTCDEVERRLFGYDHAEVGAAMGIAWNLPSNIVSAMRYHHRPDRCDPHQPIVDCVHVGDYFTMELGLGLGVGNLRYEFFDSALSRLAIPATETGRLQEALANQYEEYEALFDSLRTE